MIKRFTLALTVVALMAGCSSGVKLDGNARRAIDIHEGEVVDAEAFKALIRAAVALNAARPAARASS